MSAATLATPATMATVTHGPQSAPFAEAKVPSFIRWAIAKGGLVAPGAGMSVTDAVRSAGLDYMVRLIDNEAVDNSDPACPARYPMKGFFTTIRQDKDGTVTPLSVVKSRYAIADNINAFDFAQALVDDFGANVVAAAAFGDPLGAKAYLVVKAPRTMTVGHDPYDIYMVIMNSHDGSCGLSCSVVAVRRRDGVEVSFDLGRASQKWTIRHSGDIYSKYREAEKTMRMVDRWIDTYEGMSQKMLLTRITPDQIALFVKQFLPDRGTGEKSQKTWAERRTQLHTLCRESYGHGFGAGTVLAVFNATCLYIDHHAATRGGSPDVIRARRALEGRNVLAKRRAWRLLSEQVAPR